MLGERITKDDIPGDGDFPHRIAPTLLNSTTAENRVQVAVLGRTSNSTNDSSDQRRRKRQNDEDEEDNDQYIVLLANKNVTFTNSTDGPSFQNILVQPINEVLSIPGNLSSVAQSAGLDQISQLLQSANLIQPLQSAKGITLFAPTDAAVRSALQQIQSASKEQQMAVLANHVINGTVVYSSQLPFGDDDDSATRNATSASGQVLSFEKQDGGMTVRSGNITARILQSDVLIGNGVVHSIDSVLLNTEVNQQAADEAASSAAEKASTSTDAPGSTPTSGNNDGGSGDGSLKIASNLFSSSLIVFATVYALIM